MLVPAEIRRALQPQRDGTCFYLVIGVNGRPWMYTERYYESLMMQAPAALAPGEDIVAFNQLSSLTWKLGWDKQGRVLVPDDFLQPTGTGTSVVLIGARDHLELWNRAEWQERRRQLVEQHAQILLRASRAVQPPPAT